MAQIPVTITFDTGDLTSAQALQAFCEEAGYEVHKFANETQAQFFKRRVGQMGSDVINSALLRKAREAVSLSSTVTAS